MHPQFSRIILGTLLLPLVLLATSSSQAQSFSRETPIVDKAGLFSKDAVAKANATLNKLASKQSRELVVETFPAAPEDILKSSTGDKKQLPELFRKWARQRANSLSVNGIYVLICSKPHYVQPLVGENTKKYGLFSAEDTRKLGKILRDHLKAGDADAALLQAVDFVSATLQDRTGKASKTKSREGGTLSPGPNQYSWLYYLGIAVLIGLGIWILIGLFRAFSGTGSRPGEMTAGPGPYPQAGGGGIFSSFLTGMLGGMAGAWVYNQFFGGQHSDTGTTPSEIDSSIPTDVGGEYDDAGAGGFYQPEDSQSPTVPEDDFGGDDFGGGDFDGGGFDGGDFGDDGGGNW